MRSNRLVTALAGIALVASCAACGSSGPGSSGSKASAGGSGGDAVAAKVQADVAKAATRPTSVGYSAKIPTKIPTGKKLVIMNCGIGGCVDYANAAQQAAKALGWKPTVIQEGSTIQSITAAWNLAVRLKPDAVVESGGAYAAVTSQLKQLHAENVPVVWATQSESSTTDVTFIDSLSANQAIGSLMAKYVLSKTGSDSNFLGVQIPQYEITVSIDKVISTVTKQYCSSCKVATLDLDASDLGNGANITKVVGYLRAHPKVTSIGGSGAFLSGVAAALKRAGMNNIDVIVWSAQESDLADIKAGLPVAAVGSGWIELGWKLVDVVARKLVGAPTDVATNSVLPHPLITKANLIKDPYVANYESQFTSMWGR